MKHKQGKSIQTLAEEYDVCRGFIYAELNRGFLEATKFGRKTIVTAPQEKAWVERKSKWKPVA